MYPRPIILTNRQAAKADVGVEIRRLVRRWYLNKVCDSLCFVLLFGTINVAELELIACQ